MTPRALPYKLSFVYLLHRLVLCFLVFLPILASAETSYTIDRVIVETSATSATMARTQALNDAKHIAFEQLSASLKQTNPSLAIPQIDDRQLDRMIKNLQIVEERMTSTSYKANITIQFDGPVVEQILGIAVTEPPLTPTNSFSNPIPSNPEVMVVNLPIKQLRDLVEARRRLEQSNWVQRLIILRFTTDLITIGLKTNLPPESIPAQLGTLGFTYTVGAPPTISLSPM